MTDLYQSAAIANYDVLMADLTLLLPTEFDRSASNLSKYCDWSPEDMVRAALHSQMYPTGSRSDDMSIQVAKIVRGCYEEPLALLEAYRLLVARFILAEREREAKMSGERADKQLYSATHHGETGEASIAPDLPTRAGAEGTGNAGMAFGFQAGISSSGAVFASQQTIVPGEESIVCPVPDAKAPGYTDATVAVGTEMPAKEEKANGFADTAKNIVKEAAPFVGPLVSALTGVDAGMIVDVVEFGEQFVEQIAEVGESFGNAKEAMKEAVDIGTHAGEVSDAETDLGRVPDSAAKIGDLFDTTAGAVSHSMDTGVDTAEILGAEAVGRVHELAVKVGELAGTPGASERVVGSVGQAVPPDAPPRSLDATTGSLAGSAPVDQLPVPSDELSTGNESKSSCGPALPALQPTGPPLSATVRSDEWVSPLFSRDGPDLSPATSFGEAVRFAGPEAYVTKIIDQRLAPLEVKLDKVADIIAALAPLRCLAQCLATCASAQAANAASAFASTAE